MYYHYCSFYSWNYYNCWLLSAPNPIGKGDALQDWPYNQSADVNVSRVEELFLERTKWDIAKLLENIEFTVGNFNTSDTSELI